MQALHRAREQGTLLVRVIADGDDVVPGLLHHADDQLRCVPADVDSTFGHRLDRERMHGSCPRLYSLRPETISHHM